MTETVLRSIRRWVITIALLLSVLLVYQTFEAPVPEVVDATVTTFAAATALVAALWLWHSFRGATGTGTAADEAPSAGEN
ncbi:hypothetical protein [Haloarchaeobius litoreus]|uniref:Uncharacterized protein n=1 Tax=Haloarchaeobius litoreus TaxID=755306 RepID=A0ABD6DHI7_9EURY|nr:hypothetical protein [Haloarchaeobius litoreus]